MRVLHVIPAIAPRYGGPSQAVLSMCRALEARGVGTVIATTDADGSGRLDVPAGCPVSRDGVTVLFFRRQWSEALKCSAPLARWLDAHVGEFDCVHVHGVFSHACLAAGRACRRRAVPYVVRPLGSLDPWSLAQKRLRKRLLWHAAARRLVHGAAALHYTADGERRLAERALDLTRGIVIPLGVDEDVLRAWTDVEPGLFRRRHPELGSAPYVLSLSRLHPKKRLEALVEAFCGVTSTQGPLEAWRLVIAGDGEASYVGELRRFVERRARPGRVLLTGWLSGRDRLAAYRDAGLFVLPSWQENFALSVAEALALGVPVVVSDRVSLADDVQEARAGWVVPPDLAVLQDVLRRAMVDEAMRVELGRAGRALAHRRFRWTVVAGQLEELYRALVAGVTEPAGR